MGFVAHDFEVEPLYVVIGDEVIEGGRGLRIHFLFEAEDVDVVLHRNLAVVNHSSLRHVTEESEFDMSFVGGKYSVLHGLPFFRH